jgi:pimeloyl-ACP methyl ester carboxylesterase
MRPHCGRARDAGPTSMRATLLTIIFSRFAAHDRCNITSITFRHRRIAIDPLLNPSKSSLHRIGNTDLTLELERRGSGPPLLLLCGEEALELEAPFLDQLGRRYEVILPSPPGFGRSSRPDWIRSPDDIAYAYLDLIDDLCLDRVPVLGCSLGGWIAAEIATKNDRLISKLILVDPYGIRIGKPTDRDIADVWLLHPDEVAALKWCDVEKGKRGFPSMPEEKLTIIARNSESFARFCWEPYMHNPQLGHRLHRIKVPTLLVWGERDGIVTPAYGQAYRDLIPDSRLILIPDAGHLPHIEQQEAFMGVVGEFLGW